ncbi:VPLPA-CTERM sorting domain-containing protein [Maliponia aquimaris]|uniref:VPLPA-CTERM protein sorting domain protein n=1 Tax=Maliponia aquimaris TaxID=1673631 RepID=A0A238KKM9_9RHOB|nr:VPLPA-CTERM sorting domain-containing protein [Maliponia aquimaris]SMX42672.1 hypothetical protein MAA8898_02682 [Maliponia aquimaris]
MIALARLTALSIAVAAGILSAPAHAASINWGAEGGSNEFASDAVLFSGFQADTLVSITSQGYYFTNNGALNPVTFKLEVLLDGIWTAIFTDVTTGTSYMNVIPSQSFAYGTVTGLRATGTGQVPGDPTMRNWALGSAFTPTIFHFDALQPPSAVPVPAGLPLLLAGLGALGFASRRRRT